MPLKIDQYQQRYGIYKEEILQKVYRGPSEKWIIQKDAKELTQTEISFLINLEEEIQNLYNDCQAQAKNSSAYVGKFINIVAVAGAGLFLRAAAAPIVGNEMATAVTGALTVANAAYQMNEIDKIRVVQEKAQSFLRVIPSDQLETFIYTFSFSLVYRFGRIIERLDDSSIQNFSEFFVECLSLAIFEKNLYFADFDIFLVHLIKNITPPRGHNIYLEPIRKGAGTIFKREKRENRTVKFSVPPETHVGSYESTTKVAIHNVLLDTPVVIEGGLVCRSSTKPDDELKNNKSLQGVLSSMPQRFAVFDDAICLNMLAIHKFDYTILYENFFNETQKLASPGIIIERKIPNFFDIVPKINLIYMFSTYVNHDINQMNPKRLCTILENIYSSFTGGIDSSNLASSLGNGSYTILPLVVLAEKFMQRFSSKIHQLHVSQKPLYMENSEPFLAKPRIDKIRKTLDLHKRLYVIHNEIVGPAIIELQTAVRAAEVLNAPNATGGNGIPHSGVRHFSLQGTQAPQPVPSPSFKNISYDVFKWLWDGVRKPFLRAPQAVSPTSFESMSYEAFKQLWDYMQKPYDFVDAGNDFMLTALGIDPNSNTGKITKGVVVVLESAALGYCAGLAAGSVFSYFQCSLTTQYVGGALIVVAVEIVPLCRVGRALTDLYDADEKFEIARAEGVAQIRAVDAPAHATDNTNTNINVQKTTAGISRIQQPNAEDADIGAVEQVPGGNQPTSASRSTQNLHGWNAVLGGNSTVEVGIATPAINNAANFRPTK